MVWHGRHLLVSALRTTLMEADQVDEVLGIADIQVAAIVAVHGTKIVWGALEAFIRYDKRASKRWFAR